MKQHLLPLLYLFLGLIVGVSLGYRPEKVISLLSPHNAADSILANPDTKEQSAFTLFTSLVSSPVPTPTPTPPPSFPLPNTFDQLMNIKTPLHEPVLSLTDKWKKIIESIRTHHKPTELIANSLNSEYLCAGYIAELTVALRWPGAPQRVGLYNHQADGVCDAREIPYCYWYYGWSILYDIWAKHGWNLQKDAHRFTEIVTPEEMIRFFAAAFRPENLLSDIGFIYHDSNYLSVLGMYGNYNTHISKNMGLSDFTTTIEYPHEEVGIGNDLLLRNSLGCTEEIRPLIKPLLSRYAFTINGTPARYLADGSVVLVDLENELLTPYTLKTLDQVTYTDITLAHFYDGEQVDSLLQLTCQWEFYPVNVLEINPKFIEKM